MSCCDDAMFQLARAFTLFPICAREPTAQGTASVVVIVAEDCTNGSATMKVDANEISQYGS